MAIGGKRQDAREAAEELGLKALEFMTQDPERLAHFMNETGFTPQSLTATAGDAATLTAVLDHLLADESLLLVFAADEALDPASIWPARAVLGGGESELYGTRPTPPPPQRVLDKLPLPKRRMRSE